MISFHIKYASDYLTLIIIIKQKKLWAKEGKRNHPKIKINTFQHKGKLTYKDDMKLNKMPQTMCVEKDS